MIVNGTDGDARTAHDTLLSKAGHMWCYVIGDRGMIQIGDMHLRRKGYGAGAHAAITTYAHVDFEPHLLIGQWPQVGAMRNSH